MGINELQFFLAIASALLGFLFAGILLGMVLHASFCNLQEISTMFRALREKKKQSTNVSPPERDRE